MKKLLKINEYSRQKNAIKNTNNYMGIGQNLTNMKMRDIIVANSNERLRIKFVCTLNNAMSGRFYTECNRSWRMGNFTGKTQNLVDRSKFEEKKRTSAFPFSRNEFFLLSLQSNSNTAVCRRKFPYL